MINRELVMLTSQDAVDLEIPVMEARGARPGPVLTLLAGVHGCEYAPMAALRTFMRSLDTAQLSGTVRAVLTTNPTAFRERTPFTTPDDGKNLNRCFPGDPAGSHSERLADFIFTRFVRGSDALIDLHAGDLFEALSPFTLYDESSVTDRARALAVSYGLPLAIRQQQSRAAVTGSTSQAAAQAGIPAIIAEAGGCGLVTTDAVTHHLHGLRRTLCHLRMLPQPGLDTAPRPSQIRHLNRFTWLNTPVQGWWESAVPTGTEVTAGTLLGSVLDPFGDERARITAPEDGIVVFLTSSPAVAADGLLLALAAEEAHQEDVS